MNNSSDALVRLIKINEGCRLKPYFCTADKTTIGWGRCLDTKGISQYEADLMLKFDIEECLSDLNRIQSFRKLSGPRRCAVIDMRYQLGGAGLRNFKKMWAAIDNDDYKEAGVQILDSRYATQTPGRADVNSKMMVSNRYPEKLGG